MDAPLGKLDKQVFKCSNIDKCKGKIDNIER